MVALVILFFLKRSYTKYDLDTFRSYRKENGCKFFGVYEYLGSRKKLVYGVFFAPDKIFWHITDGPGFSPSAKGIAIRTDIPDGLWIKGRKIALKKRGVFLAVSPQYNHVLLDLAESEADELMSARENILDSIVYEKKVMSLIHGIQEKD